MRPISTRSNKRARERPLHRPALPTSKTLLHVIRNQSTYLNISLNSRTKPGICRE